MAEKIFIADKPTLDSVKDDTAYIRNKVKNGGSSLETYTTLTQWSSVDADYISTHSNNDYYTLLDINGPGTLHYILLHKTVTAYGLVIHIDGKNIIVGNGTNYQAKEAGFTLDFPAYDKARDMPFRNLVTFNIPFKTLKITGYNRDFGTVGYTLL